MSAPATDDVEFVLLGIPDLNASLRGKALSAQAFESAVRNGAAMTDLLLALDPLDVPIADYERFGIRSGAAAGSRGSRSRWWPQLVFTT